MRIILVYNSKCARTTMHKVLNNTKLILSLLKGVWSKWKHEMVKYLTVLFIIKYIVTTWYK